MNSCNSMEHLTDSVLFDNTYEAVEFIEDDPPKQEVTPKATTPKRPKWNLAPIWIVVGVLASVLIICCFVVAFGLLFRTPPSDKNETAVNRTSTGELEFYRIKKIINAN